MVVSSDAIAVADFVLFARLIAGLLRACCAVIASSRAFTAPRSPMTTMNWKSARERSDSCRGAHTRDQR